MKDCSEKADCAGRREFLVKAAFMAGGLVLTLSGANSVLGSAPRFKDLTIEIDGASPLSKVGGSLVVDSTVGKIIILRTGHDSFVAFSAVCTHKGGIVKYDASQKVFLCPKHGSTFDTATGDVTNGPAKTPLPKYPAKGSASSVTVGIK